MNVFCIDIGNTHTHYGAVREGQASAPREVLTGSLDDPEGPLVLAIRDLIRESEAPAIAFCSVVPAATERLLTLLAGLGLDQPPFQLTCQAKLEMKINYPRPEEIGQDRLANAMAAVAYYPLPCIVIDMGTAVTFDVVTSSGGYEGGIIAPGLRIMTRYLHEQTALLPDIDEDLSIRGAIGHSTSDAMKIGCVIGFGGMIQALLDAIIRELTERGEGSPTIVATGGTTPFLQRSLRQKLIEAPAITLQGLAHAYALNKENPTP